MLLLSRTYKEKRKEQKRWDNPVGSDFWNIIPQVAGVYTNLVVLFPSLWAQA